MFRRIDQHLLVMTGHVRFFSFLRFNKVIILVKTLGIVLILNI